MENKNRTDLEKLVCLIYQNKILLPDFQRRFVWTPEDMQMKLVASVLARMPIGSILLLKAKLSDYKSKLIGCKLSPDLSGLSGEGDFLLDGQQRITVLSNVFSNIIHERCPNVKDLNSPSLKRRFFLCLPRWCDISEDQQDIFGIHNLTFHFKSQKEEPDFLSGDVLPYILCLSFKANGEEVFHPQKSLTPALDQFCANYPKGYLLPLYLLANSDTKYGESAELRLEQIINQIGEEYAKEIEASFTNKLTLSEKKAFGDKLFGIQSDLGETEYKELFRNTLKDKKILWVNAIRSYLKYCINDALLNQFVVSAEQRKRAIDIYENLNRGGVSLNTFDLIMARVATVTEGAFDEKMENCMRKEHEYPVDVLPDAIQKDFTKLLLRERYNATIKTGCLNEEKNEISKKYIDVFLDVLCLYCNNKGFADPTYDLDRIKVEQIKREKILDLDPIDINENCELICRSIDRAMFFLQTRCAIRNIAEVNYSLIIVLLAFLFIRDEVFSSKKDHDILEAWYWACVFSGEFDKDQNTKLIQHLKKLIKVLVRSEDTSWIGDRKDLVLTANDFSDKELLLMEKTDEDRFPKEILRYFVGQYYLSQTYSDLFDPNKQISVFCEDADELEAHHIIPLGSAADISTSTQKLRKDSKNLCNSPLNFAYITKKANKKISSDSLETYYKRITAASRHDLNIPETEATLTDDEIRSVLEKRFDSLKGNIESHISKLLN